MAATQTVRHTTTKTVQTKTTKRGLAAIAPSPDTSKKKVGRPKGSKDTKPRKPRSDKGKKRGSYAPRKAKA